MRGARTHLGGRGVMGATLALGARHQFSQRDRLVMLVECDAQVEPLCVRHRTRRVLLQAPPGTRLSHALAPSGRSGRMGRGCWSLRSYLPTPLPRIDSVAIGEHLGHLLGRNESVDQPEAKEVELRRVLQVAPSALVPPDGRRVSIGAKLRHERRMGVKASAVRPHAPPNAPHPPQEALAAVGALPNSGGPTCLSRGIRLKS